MKLVYVHVFDGVSAFGEGFGPATRTGMLKENVFCMNEKKLLVVVALSQFSLGRHTLNIYSSIDKVDN